MLETYNKFVVRVCISHKENVTIKNFAHTVTIVERAFAWVLSLPSCILRFMLSYEESTTDGTDEQRRSL